MSLQSFSALRVSATQYAIDALSSNLTALRTRVDQGTVVRVAGPVPGEVASLGHRILDRLGTFASAPLRLLWEVSACYGLRSRFGPAIVAARCGPFVHRHATVCTVCSTRAAGERCLHHRRT